MSSGDALLIFTAHDAELPIIGAGLAPAVLTTVQTTPATGPQDKISVLAMPDDDEYTGIWTAFMPNHYTGGGVLVDIIWETTPTTGIFQCSTWFNKLDVGDPLLTQVWFGNQSTTQAAQAVSRDINRMQIQHDDGAQIGNLVANDYFRFSIRRLAPGPPDSITGDVRILAVYVTEQ